MATQKESQLDGGYGWMVTFACFLVSFIMQGLARTAGVLYVAIIDLYGVSREVATAPFSLRFGVRNMSGPIVGILAQRFGMRTVVVAGGILASIGGALSAIAPNVTWITIFWGVVHGIGYGLCNTIHVLILNEYFDKYKATAIAIALTGDCFGSFIFPTLLDFLLFRYGVSGTFLILGAISLNVVPAGLIMRLPDWSRKQKRPEKVCDVTNFNETKIANKHGITNKAFDINETFAFNSKSDEKSVVLCSITGRKHSNLSKIDIIPPEFNEYTRDKLVLNNSNCGHTIEEIFVIEKTNSNSVNQELNNVEQIHSSKDNNTNIQLDNESKIDTSKRKDSLLSRILLIPTNVLSENIDYVKLNEDKPTNQRCNSLLEKSVLNQLEIESKHQRSESESFPTTKRKTSFIDKIIINFNKQNDTLNQSLIVVNDLESNSVIASTTILNDTSNEVQVETSLKTKNGAVSKLMEFLSLNTRPLFLLIGFNLASYSLILIAVITILVDYAADNNISSDLVNYIIIIFSVTDLFGRVAFGVILDKKLIKLSYYSAANLSIMGLSVLAIPFISNYWYMMVCMSVFGLMSGGSAIIYPLLVEEYMNKGEESVALGCLNFYGGIIMLPMAPMIGFFRDAIGKYDGLFYTSGGLCFLAGISWVLEPFLLNIHQRMCKKALS